MAISLENVLRDALDQHERNHDYAIATDTVRAIIDLYKEQNPKVEEPLQAIDLLPQLEKWIKDSETQSTIFLQSNMPTALITTNSMAQAYWNVKSLIEENLKK
jgi:hypothetical protein